MKEKRDLESFRAEEGEVLPRDLVRREFERKAEREAVEALGIPFALVLAGLGVVILVVIPQEERPGRRRRDELDPELEERGRSGGEAAAVRPRAEDGQSAQVDEFRVADDAVCGGMVVSARR